MTPTLGMHMYHVPCTMIICLHNIIMHMLDDLKALAHEVHALVFLHFMRDIS